MHVGFLVSRRWVLFAIAVGMLAFLAFRLGEWQFHRLEDREDRNRITERNLAAAAMPIGQVLKPGQAVTAEQEWQPVTATGTYAEDESVIVRYQTRDGKSGVDVVTPLVTGSGIALLVNRGWLATDNVGTTRPEVPSAPAGKVTVVGWVRADATGDSAQVADRSTRAISSTEIAPTLSVPAYRGFVELRKETPSPQQPLTTAQAPDLSEGPHFFYGLQWWFFAVLALSGFGYLAWDERRKAQSARVIPPSTGTMAPDTNDAAGDSRNAAVRPNSSGRP
ncbi:MAG: SURF1 family protein [Actinomycetota bacterium]|nr:SURF1 family protein [Actinomycetota bacterium]